MMRNLIGLLIGIVCCCQLAQAGPSLDGNWKVGKITFKNGQTLAGELQYNLEENVVVLRSGTQMQAYGARSVQSFFVVDSVYGTSKKFFTVKYQDKSELPQEMFFELVFDDSFTLFAREREVSFLALKTANCPMVAHPAEENKALALDYYVFLPDGRFEEFNPGRRGLSDLLSLNGEEAQQLNRYIIGNSIDLTTQRGIIQLIYHYINDDQVAYR